MLLRRRSRVPSDPAPAAGPRAPRVEVYEGVTITPEEGKALRVDSAADVDPNVRRFGLDGVFQGGAGGYGGAGTK